MKRILQHLHLPSPVEELHSAGLSKTGVRVFVKRDDLIHPLVSGNKWRKLKYSVWKAIKEGKDRIVTQGGPFSNHLVAVALVARLLGMRSRGYIRSYVKIKNNPTLDILEMLGMEIEISDPGVYNKLSSVLHSGQETDFWIPEGGTNFEALRGLGELWGECSDIEKELFTHAIVPVGTAGTLAGLALNKPGKIRMYGVSAFKSVPNSLPGYQWLPPETSGCKIIPSVFPIRFAAFRTDLVEYINEFYAEYGLLLDPVYTARTMKTLFNLIESSEIPPNSKVLFIHTGGLQGIPGFNFMHGQQAMIEIPDDYRFLVKPEMTFG